MTLEEIEKQKYDRVWGMSEYRQVNHGMNLWLNRSELFPITMESFLDIGCGLGDLFAEFNFRGIDAWGIDITKNCLKKEILESWEHKFIEVPLWNMELKRKFDFAICADVMEHIPREMVVRSLTRIFTHCKETLFKIAIFVGNDLGGPPLHLTRKPARWWITQMERIGGEAEGIEDYIHRPNLPDFLIKWKHDRR